MCVTFVCLCRWLVIGSIGAKNGCSMWCQLRPEEVLMQPEWLKDAGSWWYGMVMVWALWAFHSSGFKKSQNKVNIGVAMGVEWRASCYLRCHLSDALVRAPFSGAVVPGCRPCSHDAAPAQPLVGRLWGRTHKWCRGGLPVRSTIQGLIQ